MSLSPCQKTELKQRKSLALKLASENLSIFLEDLINSQSRVFLILICFGSFAFEMIS